jgi:hypothetical protein
MVRHSVILYRHDRPGDARPIRFDGEQWPTYVPIRLPRTRCIEERLPPGAAAMLINQSHTYPDIVLPIDAAEKRLLDAIDGQRSIAEILDKTSAGRGRHKKHARIFFERLWWYDQVVFDASRKTGRTKVDN